MQYLGGKLSAAQLQVAGWVGSVRRSLQGALELVWGAAGDEQEEEEKEEDGGDGGGRLQRAVAPLRSLARRSRRSLHRFSIRSRQTPEACSVRAEDQLKSYCTEGEGLDTGALIGSEPDQQHGACEQTSPETDSPKPIPDHGPEVSRDDLDATPLPPEPELPAFPESSAPLLDTNAQRSRAELRKRRSQRTRLPLSVRQIRAAPAQTESPSPDWRACDSTDGKVVSSKQRGSDSEEEQPRPKEFCSPPPTSQRVPMFPGLSPFALMAQLKKRAGVGGGGGGGEEAAVEKDSPSEEAAPSPSQLSRSSRSPALRAGSALVLPPLGGTDEGTAPSPSWLKELKSKRRLSQHDSEV